ncbi:MAG: [NiFe] hydrogenase metallocenter assembly protein HypE [Labilithrix sp.]|nr:[NiFe] hydrogenase metallocenter assembly protein HypE [Labilithrix sp.]
MSSETMPSLQCAVPFAESGSILLGHGSGGKLTARLIEDTIVPALSNPLLATLDDQVFVPIGSERVAFTTDSFVVTPIFFPGGDIGELAVNGTVNDLAMGGAVPRFLSLAFILEEGLPIAELERVLASVRRAADRAGVVVVTGDTKVVGRGSGDKIFVNTAGLGTPRAGVSMSARRIRPGDSILVSGTLGDHGMAILALREGLELEGDLVSDTAPLHGIVAAILDAFPDVHAMRDPTRGGIAATLVEIASRQRVGIEIEERAIPVKHAVRGACEIFGLDPMFVANEGKLVAFVPPEGEAAVLRAMRAHPLGRDAACIGRVTSSHGGTTLVRTAIGGQRALDLPFAEALPRIC